MKLLNAMLTVPGLGLKVLCALSHLALTPV
jgi:hypothetical protein